MDNAEIANNFGAGVANGLSFGLSGLLINETGNSGAVDENSTAYKVGDSLVLEVSMGRLVYAGSVKIGAKLAENGMEANATRNLLKKVFRLGPWGSDYLTYEDALLKKGSDAGVQAAAGRTNRAFNLWGLGSGLSSGYALSASDNRCQNEN